MAIKRFAGDKFTGLSTDTKPTDVLTGATFWETNTGSTFVYNGTSWQGSPSSPTTLSGQTDVSFTGLANDDLLQYDSGASDWVNVSGIDADLISSGTFADARISETSVTQHEAALTITESQISDLQSYLTSEANDLTAAVVWDDIPDGNVPESAVTQHEAALDITTSNVAGANKTGADTDFVTGTAGTNGNIAQWNVDGDVVDGGIATSSIIVDGDVGSANGVASLDGSGLVPTSQLPALSLTSVSVVADITERDALTVQEGDVAIVTDASADPDIDSGRATYIYDGSSWQLFADPSDIDTTLSPVPNQQIAYGNASGDDLDSEAALSYNRTDNRLIVTGSIRLDEGGNISTPSRGEADSYVETEVIGSDTVTRVMTRLSNGDDVILASFIEPT